MTRKTISLATAVFFITFISACGKKSGDETKKEKENQVKAISVKEAVDLVNGDEANSGKEITVKGICWNKSSTEDGVIHVDMGDVKLDGMQQAPLSANFAADKKDALANLKKDMSLTVKGKIMKTPYVIYMDNCELIKIE